jgi:hypothetical protein
MEYKALLAPGLHVVQINDLKIIFAEPFDNPDKRFDLIDKFKEIIKRLMEFGIYFEIFIDGSFVTNKENPNDIDMCVFIEDHNLDLLTDPEKEDLKMFVENRNELKLRYNCDMYFAPNDFGNRNLWLGTFGFDDNDNPKGIARLEINKI